MIILTGKNLGERQRQLNEKVNDAAKDKIDFNTLQHLTEKSDVDMLFKIDLAAKYKNVEYIIHVFKCGDNLYISRALDKCTWLCDKDYAQTINKDYLSVNIFPLMSIKMKKKLLTNIATHLNDDDERAVDFYTYCMKMKLHNIALKFLFHTPEAFKLDVILENPKALNLIKNMEDEYLSFFVRDSFVLAENYIKNVYNKSNSISVLRYMYSISNEKYLDMLEANEYNVNVLGRRLSKHIIQHYKSRVMKKPLLYVNVLNRDVISRNSTIDEAKIFAVALLPDKPCYDFHANNKFVLDLIPTEEKFVFIKKIFTEKFPDQAFETCYNFYSQNCYNIMTVQEREAWALHNIASKDEILGSDNDYLWYKFVNFEKALVELNKYIMKTTEFSKRSEMLKVLIDSAKNEKELTKLLKYFNDRHRNEVANVKYNFLEKLISINDVWRFGEDSWMALERLFYSSNVFDNTQYQDCISDCRILALMYYILNKKPLPKVLNDCIDTNTISYYVLKKYNKKLNPEETETIFQYLLKFYVKKIESLSSLPYSDDTKENIRRYLRFALNLAQHYEKTKNDLPEIMHTYLRLDWSEFKHHQLLNDTFSLGDIIHYLKEDAEKVVNEFSKIIDYVKSTFGNINWLLHKLKIYFSHDISENYVTLFQECLSADYIHHIEADVAVYGILVLADETSKNAFMKEYTPKDKIIDNSKLPMNTLKIQKSICSQMPCSRPPLQLSIIFQYVIGDYVQYCLPSFRSYMINLPYPLCLEFVESLIDKPISIQKHGLRLAFECFDEEKLKKIILDSWNKTKNVSLRMVLYKSLFMTISNKIYDTQLFEVLITLTLDLNEDDDKTLLQLIHVTTDFPDHLVGRYLESAWNTLSKFTDTSQNVKRMNIIIHNIENRSVHLFSENFLLKIIDDHVAFMLDKGQILNTKIKESLVDLLKTKWLLTISYLVHVVTEKKLKKNSEVVKHIIKQCVKMWDKHDESGNKYIIRYFLKGFIEDLVSKSYENNDEISDSYVVILFESILQDIVEKLPEREIYMLIWNLKSSIRTKKIVLQLKQNMKTVEDDEKQIIPVIRKYAILLGTEYGMLIKRNVEEGKFYRVFFEQLECIISTNTDNFISCIKTALVNSIDVYIPICLGLLVCEIPETYMFALKFLPTDYEDIYVEDYIDVIKRIQAFQNTELQYYVYEKFVNTDFKPRNYITTK